MKKFILFVLPVSVLCLFFCSCNGLTAGFIEGTYSYKTSGIVSVTSGSSTNDASLDNIIGTLDVKRLNKDSILLMFNEMNGDMVTVNAQVKGDSILMPPYQKVFSITTSTSTIFQTNTTHTTKYLVTLTGYGIMMDDILMFYQKIVSGKVLDSGESYSIKANNLKTMAKKNR